MNSRVAAARVVFQVMCGSSLSDCLPKAVQQLEDPRDQGLLQALCYGVCRHYYSLTALLNSLLEHPLKESDDDVYALLLVGLYQLRDMRIPAYAAVNATVDATKGLDKAWARGLVNAILRNYQRHADVLNAKLLEDPVSQYAHPGWLVGMIKKAWPADCDAIMAANNEHPPFMLRVNQRHGNRAAYLEKLAAMDIAAQAIAESESGIVLEEAMDVHALPGFADGDVSVQDGAAQLAAELLMLEPGLRVLDACAAPGGKTAHIAEREPDLAALVAVDQDEKRLLTITENLARLKLSATCIASDVANVDAWWDKQLFDRILLDAPCSATGVIRRHPDIKLLRRADDIQNLVQEQLHLLTAVWALLKIDGVLLYATCSILPRENTGVLKEFLANNPDAKEEIIQAEWGNACEIGRQILPGMHGMDGFYYARLKKMAPINA
jgi:16S rRNA (cytosine967-C5)-methyltransferase